MTKINKTDLENIAIIRKEFKLKNISIIKIKKGDYEIEISSQNSISSKNIPQISSNDETEVGKKSTQNNIKNDDIVKSPMVGVAYLSADPSSPQYAKEGHHVKQGDTLLLIEAMKTFNEIKAPRSGIIKKIIVLNSQPVEFGDDLIILE